MANDLNISYNIIWHLEEKNKEEYKLNHKTVLIINKIIDYLDIRNELDYSQNEYVNFILNNQSNIIKELLNNYSKKELSKILNITPNTITRWINGNIVISKENYYKIKKMLEN